MGILENLAKSPGLLALGALAIGLFVFRDRISGFFSDITGGAQGTASIAELGGILSENLTSNLTLTPLPKDPIFGEMGFFANISKTISEFKLPSFELSSFAEPEVTGGLGSMGGTGIIPEPEGTGGLGSMGGTGKLPEPTSQLNLGQEQPFTLAPLGAQTLTSIIDKFMVTASQAANIKFIAQQGGDPFATPENIFGENPPAVTSGLGLEGLTPEQIFSQLFGNVQNPDF